MNRGAVRPLVALSPGLVTARSRPDQAPALGTAWAPRAAGPAAAPRPFGHRRAPGGVPAASAPEPAAVPPSAFAGRGARFPRLPAAGGRPAGPAGGEPGTPAGRPVAGARPPADGRRRRGA